MLECLEDLDGSLRDRGAGLVVRHGKPEEELAGPRAGGGRRARSTSPATSRRTRAAAPSGCTRRVRRRRSPLRGTRGMTVVDDVRGLRTKNGKPFMVFTPFWKACAGRRAPRRDRRTAQGRHALERAQGPHPEARGPRPRGARGGPGAGRGVARARAPVEPSCARRVERYGSAQDDLGDDGTSRLSPYLHFGCVSHARGGWRATSGGGRDPGPSAGSSTGRDFYQHVIYHFPDNQHEAYQERYRRRSSGPAPRAS